MIHDKFMHRFMVLYQIMLFFFLHYSCHVSLSFVVLKLFRELSRFKASEKLKSLVV